MTATELVGAGLGVSELSVQYGKAQALSAVSFVAPPGKVTAIAGPNGAGKSSLLLAIYGSIRASGGIALDGADVSALAARKRARQIAIVPQGRQLFASMTVRENLQIMADMLGLSRSVVDHALDRFPVLRTRSKSLAGVLSGGEQQMLVVARALMGEPKVLLLDETMTGLAPLIVSQIIEVVRELTARDVAVVMAEPSIRSLHRVIDRGYVIIRGEIVGQADSGTELDVLLERHMGFSDINKKEQ
ncbi:MAG: putative branched-chain amino acid transporter ATPase subunit [Subtercola sp.]|nr:putative branched-chain amino acid transporter ATPase subunit [Subtercola sp.]